ncbi:HMCN1 [Scenedesmus sp. PABB004]|nr:HMCN1 [Scenedesmus sp. PABB004]
MRPVLCLLAGAIALALLASGASARGALPMRAPCAPGTSLDRAAVACVRCAAPFYCPGGSAAPRRCSRTLPKEIVATLRPGATSAADCRAAPGWQLLPGGDPERPVQCPIGSYKVGWNNLACKSCGPNFLTDGEGTTRPRGECYFPAGSGSVLLNGTVSVVPCRGGTYGRVTDTRFKARVIECKRCGPNLVTADQAPNAVLEMLPPNAGPKFCLAAPGHRIVTRKASAAAEPCPKGTWSSGFNTARQCQPCTRNTTTKGVAAVSENECTESTNGGLPPGFGDNPVDDESIIPCPKGTWSAGGLSGNCTACPAGSTTPAPQAGSMSDCSLCLAGFGSLVSGAGCTQCAPNTYTDSEQTGPCQPCPAGYVSAAGSTSVTQCVKEVQVLDGGRITSVNIPTADVPAAATAAACAAACPADARCIMFRFVAGKCELLLESAPDGNKKFLFVPSRAYASAGSRRRLLATLVARLAGVLFNLATDQVLGEPIALAEPLAGVAFDACAAACDARASTPCIAVIATRVSGVPNEDVGQGTFDCRLMKPAPAGASDEQSGFLFSGGRLYLAGDKVDCASAACPVDCAGAWLVGSCSAACGPGTRALTFQITTAAANGGAPCTAVDGQISRIDCNDRPCPVDCVGSWATAPGEACNATCGPGTLTERYTITRPPQFNGTACPRADGDTRQQSCSLGPCPWPPVAACPANISSQLASAGQNAAWPALCASTAAGQTCAGNCIGTSSATAPIATCGSTSAGQWSVTTPSGCESACACELPDLRGRARRCNGVTGLWEVQSSGTCTATYNCPAAINSTSLPPGNYSAWNGTCPTAPGAFCSGSCLHGGTPPVAACVAATGVWSTSSPGSAGACDPPPCPANIGSQLASAGQNAAWPALCASTAAGQTCAGNCTGTSSGTAPIATCGSTSAGQWSVTTPSGCESACACEVPDLRGRARRCNGVTGLWEVQSSGTCTATYNCPAAINSTSLPPGNYSAWNGTCPTAPGAFCSGSCLHGGTPPVAACVAATGVWSTSSPGSAGACDPPPCPANIGSQLASAGQNAAWPALCASTAAGQTCAGNCIGTSSGTAPIATCGSTSAGQWSVTTPSGCESACACEVPDLRGRARRCNGVTGLWEVQSSGTCTATYNCPAAINSTSLPPGNYSAWNGTCPTAPGAFCSGSCLYANADPVLTLSPTSASSNIRSMVQVVTTATATDSPGQTLTYNISDAGGLPAGSISIAPAGGAVSLNTATAGLAPGTFNVSVLVSDGVGGTDTATLRLTLAWPPNTPPDFNLVAVVTVAEDAYSSSAYSDTSFVTGLTTSDPGAGQSITSVVLTGACTTSSPLFTTGPSLTGSGVSRTLTFRTAANAFGTVACNVQATDDAANSTGGSAVTTKAFTIVVTPVNDPPSFAVGPNIAGLQTATGVQTRTSWATSISPGPANEASQNVQFNITALTSPSLFSVAPAISAAGTLTFTVAGTSFGTSTISVQLLDDGGTANGGDDSSSTQSFTISVANANPVLTLSPTSASSNIRSMVQVVTTATATDSPGQTLTYNISDAGGLPAGSISIAPAGGAVSLNTATAGLAPGTFNVSVLVSDGVGGTDTATLRLTLAWPPNTPPDFNLVAVVTVAEDAYSSSAYSDTSFVTGLTTSDPGAGQSITSVVLTGACTTSSPLFTTGPSLTGSGVSRTLTFRTAANAFGTVACNVQATDDAANSTGGSAVTTKPFTIVVTPVNDAPSFAWGSNYSATVTDHQCNNVSITVTAFVNNTSVSPGPNEASQTVSLVATAANPALFQAGPAIDAATGALTFRVSGSSFGSTLVSVVARDSLNAVSAAQTFTITVRGCATYLLNFNDLAAIGTSGTARYTLAKNGATVLLSGIPAGQYYLWTKNVTDGYDRRAIVTNTGNTNGGGGGFVATTGIFYNYGETGSPDRALGSIGSGTFDNSVYGAAITHTAAFTATRMEVTFAVETWRCGTPGNDDVLKTWLRVRGAYAAGEQLNATPTPSTAPTNTPPNFGMIDVLPARPASGCNLSIGAGQGNSPDFRKTVGPYSYPQTVTPGQRVMLHALDNDGSGEDIGAAIDDLTITLYEA